jgi:MoaA/NifB/PqqE/SkfB family radical SAM enzyme
MIGPGKIIWLSGLGEPLLLCPNMEIERLKKSKAKVFSNTNAAFQSFPGTLNKCIEAGLSFLNVSVYGWDETSYMETTGQNVFSRVKNNIDHVKKTGLPFRLSYVQTLNCPADIKQKLSDAFKYDRVRLLTEHGRANCVEQQSPPDKCALCQNYLFVSSDGFALPCVNDVSAVNKLGLDYRKVYGRKKDGYPWEMCKKCDCGGRFASAKPGFLEKAFLLDEVRDAEQG